MFSHKGCVILTLMVLRGILWVTFWGGLLTSLLLQSHISEAGGAIARIASPYRYDLLRWELEKAPSKWMALFSDTLSPPRYGDEEEIALVQEYFDLSTQIHQEKDAPRKGEENPAEVQEAIRRRLALRPQVEAIIEGQIAQALSKDGLSLIHDQAGRLNLVFPPVSFSFSPQPNLLVVSPRERIEVETTILLRPGLTVEEMETIGDSISQEDKSAVVIALGGFAAYPSLIPQDASLEFTLTAITHEWFHHYLFFLPLGQRYSASGPMTTINETVADIAGREIGCRVLERYGQSCPPEPTEEETKEPKPAEFDFNAEMRRVRLRVDELLAEGKVDEAEAFMREERDFLEGQGYHIRKLNQAYFAFHGRYADTPGSVDPTGAKLRELRRRSSSLADFVNRAAGFTQPEDLETALSP